MFPQKVEIQKCDQILCAHKTHFLMLGISLSTIVLNSRDRQGMYGMQHFRASNNKPYNKL